MINIEKLFYRILIGYYYVDIKNTKYKVTYPDIQTKYHAEILYDEIIEDNKYDKVWLTKEEIKLYLEYNNTWNKEFEEKLSQNKKLLDLTKIDLYLNFSNAKKKDSNKKRIKNIQKEIDNLVTRKSSMDHLTVEDHASSIKNQYIIMNCIYLEDELVFDNQDSDHYDSQIVQKFLLEIINNMISPSDLKKLARSELCRSYFSSCQIKKDFLNINDDYRHLNSLVNMYDNVRQHPECPSEEIIDDDDALDGWFIYQQEKIRKEKKKNEILNKVGGKAKDANEVFFISNDENELKEIFDINDMQGKQQIKNLITAAKNSDKDIKWQDLGFIKESLTKEIETRKS